MGKEIFNLNDLEEIKKSEYEYFKSNLLPQISKIFFHKGVSKTTEIKSKSILDIEKKYSVFNEEDEIYLGYKFSPDEKERLLLLFSKNLIEEKLTKKNPVFHKILNQIEEIDNIIRPILNKLDIDFSLHLSGGALRDLILNQEDKIKDLDLLIEFHDKFNKEHISGRNSSEKNEREKELLKEFFQEKGKYLKELNIDIFYGQSREKILHEIIFQSINKKMKNTEIKHFFDQEKTEEKKEKIEKKKQEKKSKKELSEHDDMIYDGLFSVIKVKKNNSDDYPIDLLLNGNRYSYLNFFDFNICKSLLTIKKPNNEMNNNIENDLYLYDGFIKDVICKTLTLNASIFSKNEYVDRCLNDHYLRLKNKYPDYKFEVNTENADAERVEYIKKAELFVSMNDKFSEKETNNKIKKNKI